MARYLTSSFVYVSKLPFETTDDEFRQIIVDKGFDEFDCFISRSENGESEGCWYVVFKNEETALSAIDKINHSVYNGRSLTAMKAVFYPFANGLEKRDDRIKLSF